MTAPLDPAHRSARRGSVRVRRRWARWAVGAIAVLVVVATVLHLPGVRPWLAARGHTGGAVCPFGYGRSTTDTGRRARRDALDRPSPRGTTAAHERPALGFDLDHATAADLARWASAAGVSCELHHGGAQIECSQVPATALPGAGAPGVISLAFELGDDGTLASIRAVRRGADAAAIAAAFAALEHQLTEHAGPPVARDGDATPDGLAAAMLRQAMIEYRFTDYRAVVRATNMGDGFVLTEEYAALARS
jgi:hypothetical protein